MKSTKRIIDNFKKRDYIYEHSDEHDHVLPLNLETTVQDLGAGGASCSSASPSATATRAPRVYKTYSSHR